MSAAVAINKGLSEYVDDRASLGKAIDKAKGFLSKVGIAVESPQAEIGRDVNPFAMARTVPEVLDLIVARVPAQPRANEARGNPITQMLKNLPVHDRVPAITALLASDEHRNALVSNFGKGLTPLQQALTDGDAGVAKKLQAFQRFGADEMKALASGMRMAAHGTADTTKIALGEARGAGVISEGHKQCLEEGLKKAGQAGFEKMLADPEVRSQVLVGNVMRTVADTLGKLGMRWPEVPENKSGMKLG